MLISRQFVVKIFTLFICIEEILKSSRPWILDKQIKNSINPTFEVTNKINTIKIYENSSEVIRLNIQWLDGLRLT